MNIATTTSSAARMDRLSMSGFHYLLLSLIGAGLFFDGIDFFLPASLLPFLVRDHLAKASDVALFPSLTAVGLLLGALLAAYFGDRRGRKVLYQFNLIVYAGGCCGAHVLRRFSGS